MSNIDAQSIWFNMNILKLSAHLLQFFNLQLDPAAQRAFNSARCSCN